jgi:23S rRNA (pseudouridine1915-N3)-methyltransferase
MQFLNQYSYFYPMKLKILGIGKVHEPYLLEGCKIFGNRLKNYVQFEEIFLPDIKNGHKLSSRELMKKEAEALWSKIDDKDFVVVLDEKGKEFSSPEFAAQFVNWNNQAVKSVVFVIGGANGMDEEYKSKARLKLAFSRFTFSHQMIRLFVLEQIYRAHTIINNEPYHRI